MGTTQKELNVVCIWGQTNLLDPLQGGRCCYPWRRQPGSNCLPEELKLLRLTVIIRPRKRRLKLWLNFRWWYERSGIANEPAEEVELILRQKWFVMDKPQHEIGIKHRVKTTPGLLHCRSIGASSIRTRASVERRWFEFEESLGCLFGLTEETDFVVQLESILNSVVDIRDVADTPGHTEQLGRIVEGDALQLRSETADWCGRGGGDGSESPTSSTASDGVLVWKTQHENVAALTRNTSSSDCGRSFKRHRNCA